jgi:tRNA pseudouridine38-40 synthase
MYRYFILLSYKGTNYHGWQIQPNAISVQEVLVKAFSTILREDIEITGAGRTDTGVHAINYIAHFNSTYQNIHLDKKFVFKLNSYLPKDIAIHNIKYVKNDAHARFDAMSRTYNYYIHQEKDPFLLESSSFIPQTLDIEKMNKAANLLLDYTDFTSFSKLHTDVKTNNCKILEAYWKQENHKIVFTVKADRFLRNMVRAIVGTLLEVGRHKITIGDFIKIIESKDRSNAGVSVPSQGLFLSSIEYPEHIFIS